MFPNDYVYKGYRLVAKVSRVVPGEDAERTGPIFGANVSLVQVSSVQDDGYPYAVPYFAAGGFTYSPAEAISIAIQHGCDIVAALTNGTDA